MNPEAFESFIQADIFFFITTIAIVLVTIGLIVAIVYVIKILRTVSEVTDKVKEESEEVIADIKTLRTNIKSEGFRLAAVGDFFSRIFGRKKSRKGVNK